MRARNHHWQSVALRFSLDGALVWLAFGFGIWLRFGTFSSVKLQEYGPSVALASLVLPVVFYIGGFYSQREAATDWLGHFRWLLFGLASAVGAVMLAGSVDFSSRVGRGVLLYAFPILVLGLALHHLVLAGQVRSPWRRVLCLVTAREDEEAAELLGKLGRSGRRVIGMVIGADYHPRSDLPNLGCLFSYLGTEGGKGFDAILVRDSHLSDPRIGALLRRLRYQGIDIVSLADACEDAFQAVPLGLVTDFWLHRASNQAGLFYIKKLKRLFDVLVAFTLLVVLFPVLVAGMVVVRLSSTGPVIFRQARAGRLERPFTVLKLRTMRVTPPSAGEEARWCEANDPRIFPAGKWLRQFRIDEIPQLYNIIRGDMSFVGPRPEQVEMIEKLNERIPFYRERLLVQPGLTGWAQVRYPYGASVEDAARKLEYDLYYMKHMSLFLDFFILIETAKIILMGGVRDGGDREYLDFSASLSGVSPPNGKDAG